MSTISSPGIGSGLDVKSIVSQLVALEKQPLKGLQTKATDINSTVSTYGQIKSLVSTLADAVSQLNSVTGWNGVSATSSNSAAVSVSAVGGTASSVFNVTVQSLAQAQSTASQALLPVGGALGGGTLHLDTGSWNAAGTIFTPGSGNTTVDVSIDPTDTVTAIASKINGSGANVIATVLSDASGERLLMSSKSTGAAAGYRLTVTDNDGTNTNNSGLSRLVSSATMPQIGQDAKATVNGVAVSSATNTFASTIPGVTFNALQVTGTAAVLTVSQDTAAITKEINTFVAAYNAVNDTLREATKYDSATKTAGPLQGDSTANGLQYSLKSILQSSVSGGAFSKLADIGITQQLGGDLAVDSTKLTTAMAKPDDVKSLFRSSSTNSANSGIATKLKSFTDGLMAASGMFATKGASLQKQLDNNAKDQATVNDRAASIEAALTKKYSALDAQISQLNSLNAYVAQQVTTWNKNTA